MTSCSPWRIPTRLPEGHDFTMYLNPKSLEVVQGKAEPSLAKAAAGRSLSVRASWVFLRGQVIEGGAARLQSHCRVAGHLGEASEEVVYVPGLQHEI